MHMNISLTPRLEKLVKQKVASGMYNSASEVMREALRLLDESDRIQAIRREELRKEVAIGIDQLDKGEGTPLDMEEIKAEGRRRRARKRKSKGS